MKELLLTGVWQLHGGSAKTYHYPSRTPHTPLHDPEAGKSAATGLS